MLVGPVHHVIYFVSPERWQQRYPDWARDRRDEIIARVKASGLLRDMTILTPNAAATPTPNRAMEPTTGRRTTKFSVTRTSHPAAMRALASGGSSCSR
jgi:hypothetical protein